MWIDVLAQKLEQFFAPQAVVKEKLNSGLINIFVCSKVFNYSSRITVRMFEFFVQKTEPILGVGWELAEAGDRIYSNFLSVLWKSFCW